MLYRVSSILIVIFWVTMTALLVRNDSSIREVPPGHVVKLILHHQQTSDLNIVGDKLRMGRVRIEGRSWKEDGLGTIAFAGNLILTLPGTKERPRIAWDGDVDMDKQLTVQRFRLGVTMHDPERLRTDITVRPQEKLVHYELSSPSGVLDQHDFSMDEKGARDVMKQLGIDPGMFPLPAPTTATPPTIKAQLSSLQIHGERMETYLVTVESNGQTWLECHENQLGQVVSAKTLVGYSLVPDDFSP